MMRTVVVGLGKTGASCVRYLAKHGIPVAATDSRAEPPGLAELAGLAERIDLRLGAFDASLLEGASQVLLSPGVSPQEPIAAEARARRIEVLGDIELFARAAGAPVIGVTGTNGKSTVTSLVARMAESAGLTALAGGNLGKPALDLLEEPVPDLYVLELSSFQLETTTSLELLAAAVLNVSADHMDRYASMADYARAKSRIVSNAATVVLNADDPYFLAMRRAVEGRPAWAPAPRIVTFSTERGDADFTLMREGRNSWLARRGEGLFDTARMKIPVSTTRGTRWRRSHSARPRACRSMPCCAAIEAFPGLKHRSEWVADVRGVRYIDDSKGTNVGRDDRGGEGSARAARGDRGRGGQGSGVRASRRCVSPQGPPRRRHRQGCRLPSRQCSRACARSSVPRLCRPP